METQTLQASPRTLKGRKTYALRIEGKVPAVVYGAGIEPKNISIDRNTFARLFKAAGESTIVELAIEGEKTPLNVLIHDIQFDPLRDEVTHADFRAVDMTKKIEAEVKLHFIGESMAIKSLGGTLVHPVETIKIRALPKDLMSSVEIDISKLASFEDAIQIKDLAIPEGVEVMEDQNMTLALVAAPRSEEELAELNKAVEIDVTQVEKVEAKKKEEEGEEGAEGAKPGAAPAAAKKEEKK